ncbi:hypothetical protein CVD28_01510 [Bacillus sp. M6-12]|uniref:hypothetical protein n=1 Tax=Bacillus sp. M6-12 TaxID=2054166 RepID=UPI000C768C60|nr:hypothetical protein [Bacillus sp. M6-12]PLS19112.1 hypothetical protein CVD28_01510 [Bacillus sp. M6-12]
MNNFIIEQLKVEEMIKRINPSVKANYEGMMDVLKKENPTIMNQRVSDTFKRIMYLQLIAHSISESCSIIKDMAEGEEKKEEVNQFEKTVLDFCKGYINHNVAIQDKESFDDNQEKVSELLLEKWSQITQHIHISVNQSALAYIQ